MVTGQDMQFKYLILVYLLFHSMSLVLSDKLSPDEVIEIVKMFVSIHNLPCSVIITTPGMIGPLEVKTLWQNNPSQVHLADRAISLDSKSNCGHFIWLGGEEEYRQSVLETVRQAESPGVRKKKYPLYVRKVS